MPFRFWLHVEQSNTAVILVLNIVIFFIVVVGVFRFLEV